MPKPLAVDWQFIQALWLQGIAPSKIQAQTGVKAASVKSRAYRLGWQLARSRANALLQKPLHESMVGQLAQAHSKALAKASTIAQESFSAELHEQVSVLQSRKPRSIAELANTNKREGRASVVKKLVETADKLYGWSEHQQQPAALNLTQVNISPASDEQSVKLIEVQPD